MTLLEAAKRLCQRVSWLVDIWRRNLSGSESACVHNTCGISVLFRPRPVACPGRYGTHRLEIRSLEQRWTRTAKYRMLYRIQNRYLPCCAGCRQTWGLLRRAPRVRPWPFQPRARIQHSVSLRTAIPCLLSVMRVSQAPDKSAHRLMFHNKPFDDYCEPSAYYVGIS